MEKRMNKIELIKLIESLKVNKNEIWIVSSGALVLREIFPDAGDLDILATSKGLEELKNNYNLVQKENGSYIVCDNVECITIKEKENLKYPLEKASGYNVQNILEYLEYLESSTRDKDKKRIPLVKEYINNIK